METRWMKKLVANIQDKFYAWRLKRDDAREVRVLKKIFSGPSSGYLECLAQGIPVTVVKGQIIFRIYPDGRKEQIGFIEEPDIPASEIKAKWEGQIRYPQDSMF